MKEQTQNSPSTQPSQPPKDVEVTRSEEKKGSKDYLVILAIILVIILIGSWYFALTYLRRGREGTETQQETTSTTEEDSDEEDESSFAEATEDKAEEELNSCTYDGVEHQHGAQFDATDGCNTCVCSDGEVSCTSIICVTDPSANSGQSPYEGWLTYENTEMGWKVKYPPDGSLDSSSTSCIKINYKNSYVHIGTQGGDEDAYFMCFRTGVGAGEINYTDIPLTVVGTTVIFKEMEYLDEFSHNGSTYSQVQFGAKSGGIEFGDTNWDNYVVNREVLKKVVESVEEI